MPTEKELLAICLRQPRRARRCVELHIFLHARREVAQAPERHPQAAGADVGFDRRVIARRHGERGEEEDEIVSDFEGLPPRVAAERMRPHFSR